MDPRNERHVVSDSREITTCFGARGREGGAPLEGDHSLGAEGFMFVGFPMNMQSEQKTMLPRWAESRLCRRACIARFYLEFFARGGGRINMNANLKCKSPPHGSPLSSSHSGRNSKGRTAAALVRLLQAQGPQRYPAHHAGRNERGGLNLGPRPEKVAVPRLCRSFKMYDSMGREVILFAYVLARFFQPVSSKVTVSARFRFSKKYQRFS